MHPRHVRAEALALVDQGFNDCEIARATGVPRSTVRAWRRPKDGRQPPQAACLRCGRATRPVSFTTEDYAELLGLYLGDGCISEHPRTARLRICLDARYPGVIQDAKSLLERSFPKNRVGLVEAPGGTMVILSMYSTHLTCLFPQDGQGKKHERRISLEEWQRCRVDQAPWGLLRGCIRSDGCAFVNRTGPYDYLTYDFSNKSRDIVELFSAACGAVGVEHRTTCWGGLWRVRINRRRSVDLMLAGVGLKS
jgi:hypothetical protein